MKKTRLASTATVLMIVGVIHPADAAELEEIVVTATKREVAAQDIPFSLSAVSGQELQRRGIDNLEGLFRSVPSLSFTDLGPGQSQISIRGISGNPVLRDDPNSKATVGIYLDEVPVSIALFTPDPDLFDLARVEVLRGPQGTLFGAGSLSGTVRFITNAPVETQEGRLQAGYGVTEDGAPLYNVKGMLNLPLTPDLALRVVGTYSDGGGFVDSRFDNGVEREDVNDARKQGLRVKAQWTPNAWLTVTPAIHFQDLETGGFPLEDFYSRYSDSAAGVYDPGAPGYIGLPVPGDRAQFRDYEEGLDEDFLLGDLTVDVDLGFASLRSTTAYIDRSNEIRRDFGFFWGEFATIFPFSALDIGRVTQDPPRGIPSNLTDTTEIRSFTQELRLVSNNDGPLQWLVGGFFLDQERDYRQLLLSPGFGSLFEPGLAALFGVPPAFVQPIIDGLGRGVTDATANNSQQLEEQQLALFSEMSYAFNEQWRFTAGVRWFDFEETKDFVFAGFLQGAIDTGARDVEEDGFNPRFILSYEPSQDLMLSAQASRGFRPGGTNDILPDFCAADLAALGLDPQSGLSYESDSLWDYELNAKSTWLDGRMTVNAAVFRMEYEDLQAGVRLACGQQIRQNVGKATSDGVEIELHAQPTEAWYFELTGSWVDATLDSAPPQFPGQPGDRLPLSPEYTLGGVARYTIPIFRDGMSGHVQFSVQAVGEKDAFFLAPGVYEPEGNTLDSYALLGFRVGVAEENWELVLWADNLTDESAEISIESEFALSRRAFSRNRPRTVGATVSYEF